MAIIYTYPTTTTLENSDLFVISKMQQEGKPTRSISVANLASAIVYVLFYVACLGLLVFK